MRNTEKTKLVLTLPGLVIGIALIMYACTYQQPGAANEDKSPSTSIPQATVIFDDESGEQSTAKNFYFLFDGSGSMDQSCSGKRKIDGAKEAVIRFLDKVPEDANLGLLVFGNGGEHDCQEVLPLGQGNREQFIKVVKSLKAENGTPLGQAIRIGADKLIAQYKKQLGYGQYRLIVITDGNANDYDLMVNACKYTMQHGFIGLYSIGLCLDRSHALKDFALSYRDANNYEDLEKALENAVAETDVFDASLFDEKLYQEPSEQ